MKSQTATTMGIASVGNVLVLEDSKVAFVRKLIVSIQLVPIMDFVLRVLAFAKKDGQDLIALRKTKLQFLAYRPVQTMESLTHTPKSVFVTPNLVEKTVH